MHLLGKSEAVDCQKSWQLEEAGAIITSPALALIGKITLFSTGPAQQLQAATRHLLELTMPTDQPKCYIFNSATPPYLLP